MAVNLDDETPEDNRQILETFLAAPVGAGGAMPLTRAEWNSQLGSANANHSPATEDCPVPDTHGAGVIEQNG